MCVCFYERDSEIGIESDTATATATDTDTEMQMQIRRKRVSEIESKKEYMRDSWTFVNIRKELH